MRIFVNDKPLELLSYEELDAKKSYESIYRQPDELLNQVSWNDDILFHEPSHDLVIKLLYVLRTRKLKNLDSITLVTNDKSALKSL
ncbi:hypothetical protein V8V91_25715 [Algoriphagus halophilus]|uniref:hypothetical protein n=1 Tax=Algoriphagus halophilus TaxID=226505 RepID=UPI00358DFABA